MAPSLTPENLFQFLRFQLPPQTSTTTTVHSHIAMHWVPLHFAALKPPSTHLTPRMRNSSSGTKNTGVMVLARVMVLAYVMVLACVMVLARLWC